MSLCMTVCVCVVCMRVCMCVCVCIYIYIYVHISLPAYKLAWRGVALPLASVPLSHRRESRCCNLKARTGSVRLRRAFLIGMLDN